MKNPKVLVACPCGKDIPIDTFNSFMGMNHSGSIKVLSGSLIDDSREMIAEEAINEGFDYVMWIDSDMTFAPEAINKLLSDNKDVICGIFVKRVPPFSPCIYEKRDGKYFIKLDVPKNEVFEIDSCGFAFTLTSTKALKAVKEEYGTMFNRAYPWGEDMSFCARYKSISEKNKIYCDSEVKIGHIGTLTATIDTWESCRAGYERNREVKEV